MERLAGPHASAAISSTIPGAGATGVTARRWSRNLRRGDQYGLALAQ